MSSKKQSYDHLISDYYDSLRDELKNYAGEELKRIEEHNILNDLIRLNLEDNDDNLILLDESEDETMNNYCPEYLKDTYSEKYVDSSNSRNIQFPEPTTLEVFINTIWFELLNELKRAENESLDRLKEAKALLAEDEQDIYEYPGLFVDIQSLKSQLFGKKFLFFINFDRFNSEKIIAEAIESKANDGDEGLGGREEDSNYNYDFNKSMFKLCTIITDFYLNPSQIEYLKLV